MKQVIVEIQGGLGNQMFEYALARSLPNKRVYLGTRDFERKSPGREFGLTKYKISIPIATEKEYLRFYHKCGLMHRLGIEIPQPYVEKQEKCYDRDVAEGKKDNILGYWQNLNYFKKIRETLIDDFSYTRKMSKRAENIKKQIIDTNSVAVHIRRGDYLLPQNKVKFEQTSLEFYQRAMTLFDRENTFFYIFSDDIEFCREMFPDNKHCVYIDKENSESMYEDLELMKHCKHFIIPNSTFSWWAAYLSTASKNKEVIVTSKWFCDKRHNELTLDALIPKEWRVI